MLECMNPIEFQLREPADLLATALANLGFQPQDSLVLLTFRRDIPSFYARVDLPKAEDGWDQVSRTLCAAARRNGVDVGAVLVYSSNHEVAACQAQSLVEALHRIGVRIIEALRAEEGRYWPLVDQAGHVLMGQGEGVAFDVSAHPLIVDRIVSGEVLLGSREELAALLAEDQQASAEVAVAIDGVRAISPHCAPREMAWVHKTVCRYLRTRALLSAADTARMLVAISLPSIRDAAWVWLSRSQAGTSRELWSDIVRRAPQEWRDSAAAILAFSAWLEGNGALAWCAVDLCRSTSPSHSMADLVADLMLGAVSPNAWMPMDLETFPTWTEGISAAG